MASHPRRRSHLRAMPEGMSALPLQRCAALAGHRAAHATGGAPVAQGMHTALAALPHEKAAEAEATATVLPVASWLRAAAIPQGVAVDALASPRRGRCGSLIAPVTGRRATVHSPIRQPSGTGARSPGGRRPVRADRQSAHHGCGRRHLRFDDAPQARQRTRHGGGGGGHLVC